MPADPPAPRSRTNSRRRGVGVAVCFGPVALLATSGTYGVLESPGGSWGLPLAFLGLLVGVFNVYLAVVRPQLYRWRHGSLDGYRHSSGVPLFGTLFVTLAGSLGFGEVPTAAVGLVTLAIDNGGLPWFLITTWRDAGMWDD